jgi:hypothetical protein
VTQLAKLIAAERALTSAASNRVGNIDNVMKGWPRAAGKVVLAELAVATLVDVSSMPGLPFATDDEMTPPFGTER